MTNRILVAALLGASLMSAPAFAQEATLRIENAAARVIVIPEARNDVVYTVQQGRAGLPALQTRQDGGVKVLDGGLGGGRFGTFGIHFGLNCQGSGDHVRVRIPGHGDIAIQDLPLVTARVPMNAHVHVSDAVFGDIGPTQSLDLGNAGCGDWRIGAVRGPLHLAMSGSGDVRGQGAGAAMVNVSGSSDVYLGGVSSLEARVSGSGDVHVASINGPLMAKIAGSGDVSVDGGAAPSVEAHIAGSGDVKFRGTAGSLTATIAGSGDVSVARVTGPVTKHIVGSGDVNVGH